MTYSVIIPVYNAERYLSACLDSVLAQDTRSEYEVILVDDGSTDSSGKICDAYVAAHPHFRVLHTENQWLSAARNNGMREAKGRYILFLDADDLWDPMLLSTLDGLIEGCPDIVTFSACHFFRSPGDGTEIHQPSLPIGGSGEAWLNKLFQMHAIPRAYAWIYGYRRAFLEKFQFSFQTGLRSAEDFEFNMRCLPEAKSILGTDRVLLHYRSTEDSLTRTLTPKKLMDNLEVDEQVFRRFPNASTANQYCSSAVTVSVLGDPQKEEQLAAFIERNWEIWEYASYRPYRLARLLFRILGCHCGSIIYMALQDLWHKHGKVGALAKRRG